MLTVLFGAGAYLGGQALPDDLYATYPEQRTLEEILNKEVSVIIYVNDRNHIFLDNLFVSGLDVLKFKPILIDAAKLESVDAEPLPEAKFIPVEILTIAPETNVSAAIKPPKKEVIPEEQPEIMTAPTPVENAEEIAPEVNLAPKEPVVKQAEIIPEVEIEEDPEAELESEVVIDPALEPEPRPAPIVETEPEPDPTPDPPSFDLDALSGLIDKTRETAPEANQQVALQNETAQARYEEIARQAEGEGNGLSATEADLVANAMQKCWRMPAAARDAENLRVRLDVKLVIGGYVESVNLS